MELSQETSSFWLSAHYKRHKDTYHSSSAIGKASSYLLCANYKLFKNTSHWSSAVEKAHSYWLCANYIRAKLCKETSHWSPARKGKSLLAVCILFMVLSCTQPAAFWPTIAHSKMGRVPASLRFLTATIRRMTIVSTANQKM